MIFGKNLCFSPNLNSNIKIYDYQKNIRKLFWRSRMWDLQGSWRKFVESDYGLKEKKSEENRSKRERGLENWKERRREGGHAATRRSACGGAGRNWWSTRVDHRLVRHVLTWQRTCVWHADPDRPDPTPHAIRSFLNRPDLAPLTRDCSMREPLFFFPFNLCLLVFRPDFDIDPIIMWIRTCQGNSRIFGTLSVKKTRTREGTHQPCK